MTKQQYFDLIMDCNNKGLFPAVGSLGCAYRGEDGRKCVIGLLIPDCEYEPDLEGKIVDQLFEQYELDYIIPSGMTKTQLYNLQYYHDGAVSNWNKEVFARRVREVFEY